MTLPNTYAVIMAGGSGTRFWPLSRGSRPKQLLPLGGDDRALIQSTVDRLLPLIAHQNILVVTNQRLVAETASLLPELSAGQILGEPVGRNTAPCIGWAARILVEKDPDALLAVFPADHHVAQPESFRATVARAIGAVAPGVLVTIGIRPTRPETGFGYIEAGDLETDGVLRGLGFVEKPDLERAQSYLGSGRHFWNSGMFFLRAVDALKLIDTHEAELGRGLRTLPTRNVADDSAFAAAFAALPSISFDNAVAERAEQLRVVPADVGWSDLGSWQAAHELAPKDARGNATNTDTLFLEASGCLALHHPQAEEDKRKLMVMVGVQDLVVVDTPDAILVLPRDQSQRVREVVQQLRQRKDDHLL